MMWNKIRCLGLPFIVLGLFFTSVLSDAQEDLSNVASGTESSRMTENTVRTSWDGDKIVVGSVRYQRPFSNQPIEIARVLKMWPAGWAGPHDEAEAYSDLGRAHRSIFELDPDLPMQLARREVVKSANALQQAVNIYKRIQHENPGDADAIAHKLASCYFDIGKTYSLSPDDAQYALALDYYVQAQKIYRELLSNQDSEYLKDSHSRSEVEVEWAQCCLRIGAILLTMDPSEAELRNLLEEAYVTDVSDGMAKVVQLATRAEDFFVTAEDVWRTAIDLEQGTKELVHLQRHLASTLQNLGAAAVMKGELKKGAKYGEKALVLHEEAINKLPKGSVEFDGTIIHIAEVLYNLADTYLHLGKYDQSKQKYRQAMDWYERHNIADPSQQVEDMANDEDDEALEEYEDALEEYNDMLTKGESRNDTGEEAFHERDDIYEGDLHASLGSLYMRKGDLFLAKSHLTKAIELYAKSGVQDDLNMADAKFNIAMLHFRRGAFKESAYYNDQALDVYRTVVGFGESPMQTERVRMPEKDLSYIKKSASAESSKMPKATVKTSWDGDTIVVGSVRYQRPFSKQPLEIAHVLQMWPTSWASPHDEAETYSDLGVAHRSLLKLDPDLPMQVARKEVLKSVNALQHAVYVYERIQHESRGDAERVAHDLATCYFDIGKTYSLSPDDAQYALALDYYVQAQKIFRELLSNQDSEYLKDSHSRTEVEVEWAQCCLRIGAILLTMDPSEVDLVYLLKGERGRTKERVYDSMTKVRQVASRAEDYFLNAEDVLRKAINLDQDTKERVCLQRHLASTLQNLGTAAVMKNELEKGSKYTEQALFLHEEVINMLPKKSVQLDDTIIHIAEVLYNLADTYLYLGKYDASKQKYRQAMQWYERHNIADPSQPVEVMADDDFNETLREYEEAMDEYNEMFAEGVEVSASAEVYCERNDVYEGDLHASLGSLYMRKGDLILAESHLTQAVNLYAMSRVQDNLNMADVMFNLAELHSRNGNFKDSAAYNDQALDIYRVVVGDGENPMQMERMGMVEKDLSYIKKQHASNQERGGGKEENNYGSKSTFESGSYSQDVKPGPRDEL